MSESLHMPKAALEDLIAILWREGFKVLGPVARDGAVAFDEVRKVSDMAVATRETQEPGRYRLVPGNADEIFGVVNGAGSLKPFFSRPRRRCLK
jgi:sulfhydrogenase subunit beta (sulfur reductase)